MGMEEAAEAARVDALEAMEEVMEAEQVATAEAEVAMGECRRGLTVETEAVAVETGGMMAAEEAVCGCVVRGCVWCVGVRCAHRLLTREKTQHYSETNLASVAAEGRLKVHGATLSQHQSMPQTLQDHEPGTLG